MVSGMAKLAAATVHMSFTGHFTGTVAFHLRRSGSRSFNAR